MAKKIDPQCRAFQEAIDLLAKPWSGLILTLLQDGPLRFSELEGRARGVGAKVLSARLKELEKRGIIVRRIDAGPPVRVSYALTTSGRAFREVARTIETWGRVLVENPKLPPRSGARRS